MRLLLDMNLSPKWCEVLSQAGWETSHWSNVGDLRAADSEILAFAEEHDYVLLTYDLDFGAILAATGARGPSVVQLRHVQDLLSPQVESVLIAALRTCEALLSQGAIVTVDAARSRVRVLPIQRLT